MKTTRIAVLLLFLLLAGQDAHAFETQTHALITREAYKRTALATENSELLKRLSLDRLEESNRFARFWSADPLPRYYTAGGQAGPSGQAIDIPAEFEACQMRDFLRIDANDQPRVLFRDLFIDTVHYPYFAPRYPIQNWLVRGAIREDDMGDYVGTALTFREGCGYWWRQTTDDQPGQIARSLYHFYDPEFDLPLSAPLVTDVKSIDWALGFNDSFQYLPTPAAGDRRNTYSYLDARNAYWWALTREFSIEHGLVDTPAHREVDARDRMALWATMFRSLGNVVHLLQDAAQPQHTRLDAHSLIDPEQQQALEGYTNARILGGKNNDVGDFVRGFYATADKVRLSVPPLGSYGMGSSLPGGSIQFATPQRYFTTRAGLGTPPPFPARAGMADYSNRGFFTGGTLPGMENTPHQSPPQDFENAAYGYDTVGSPCESVTPIDPRLHMAACWHFVHGVPDTLLPEYASSQDVLPTGFSLPKVPLLAEGVFRRYYTDQLGGVGTIHIPMVTWSPSVLDAIGNLTIPRAVGYSAGFLDYFFRGKLELSSPPDGLYAVLDQGTPHHVEDGLPKDEAGRVFGYQRVRVRVRNVTGLDSSGNPTFVDAGTREIVPQLMREGVDSFGNPSQLVAIARYHRNACYQPDLSGEFVVMPDPATGIPNPNDKRIPSGCSMEQSRTAFQEISVSAPLRIDAAGNLQGGAPPGTLNPCVNNGNINTGTHGLGAECESQSVLAQFDFSNDPIPINATDLFLQVAYRGHIGLEQDGIAVGIKDINETNYITAWNGTDWFYYHDQWVVPQDFPDVPDATPWQPAPIDELLLCFGEQTIVDMAPGETIPPARFVRIGLLSDASSLPTGFLAELAMRSNFFPLPLGAIRRQSWMEDATLAPYSPQPFLWYARGTVAGNNFLAPFYSHGEIVEDHTMQSLILNPPIGGGLPGFAREVTTGFDVAADKCRRTPPPPAG